MFPIQNVMKCTCHGVVYCTLFPTKKNILCFLQASPKTERYNLTNMCTFQNIIIYYYVCYVQAGHYFRGEECERSEVKLHSHTE